jgi:4-amino-4-deoxychorismate lyase
MARTALILVTHPCVDSTADTDREIDSNRVLGAPFHTADPGSPQLSVLDFAATRGDGIFESISVIAGIPHALDAHLSRFESSAAILDLPTPDRAIWRGAIAAALAELDSAPEAYIRAVLSRGIEGTGQPTGWVYAAPSPDYTRVRTEGVRVVFLDRGYPRNVESTSPWLLAGAKTLSYAVNRAALREAARRDADDVVFVSSDGYVLEGPTSSVLFLRGERLGTPGSGSGILPGTTQDDVFQWAASAGLSTGFENLTPAELRTTDAAWLVSSSRHAVPIISLDGAPHPVRWDITTAINAFLLTGR